MTGPSPRSRADGAGSDDVRSADGRSGDAISSEIEQAIDDGATDISDVRWWDYPIFAVFWALMIVVFLQFFSRYVLNSSIGWTEEIARYLLIVLGFSGSLICMRKRNHIHLEVVLQRVPDRLARVLRVLGEAVSMVFFGALAWTGITLAQRMSRQTLISVEISRGVFYWVIVGCLGLGAVMLALQIARHRGR